MIQRTKGAQSIVFAEAPYIMSSASVVGKKESEGPLGELFDTFDETNLFGEETWELAEGVMQREACVRALYKANVTPEQVRYLFGGDLLRQGIATSMGAESLQIPLFGLFGACSTSGEALAGNKKSNVKIAGLTIGKIVDYGLKDSQNMGACMAPAAADTIAVNLKDMGRSPEDYDRIITGDLGYVGQSILLDLMRKRKIDLTQNHMDCGMTIFNQQTQDTHSGGSGCGCAATTLAAYILPKLRTGEWKRVLFVPTGALMSTVSYNEGESVPGIAHGIVLEHEPFGKKQEVE